MSYPRITSGHDLRAAFLSQMLLSQDRHYMGTSGRHLDGQSAAYILTLGVSRSVITSLP